MHNWDWIGTAYWICLTAGLFYAVISFLIGGITGAMGHVGDLSGGHGDFSHTYGVDGHAGHGEASGSHVEGGDIIFGPFSPLVIAFYLTCFGATGILLQRSGNLSFGITLPIAAFSGFMLAWLLILFFNRVLGRMQSSSEVRRATLVGQDAEVTVPISATGIGEIAFVAMGSRYTAPARSDDQTAIPRFSSVRIARIVGDIYFVRLLMEEQLKELDSLPTTSQQIGFKGE